MADKDILKDQESVSAVRTETQTNTDASVDSSNAAIDNAAAPQNDVASDNHAAAVADATNSSDDVKPVVNLSDEDAARAAVAAAEQAATDAANAAAQQAADAKAAKAAARAAKKAAKAAGDSSSEDAEADEDDAKVFVLKKAAGIVLGGRDHRRFEEGTEFTTGVDDEVIVLLIRSGAELEEK